MKEVFFALQHMQHENQSFHESIAHLQGNQALATFGSTSKEPQINLLEKFDDTCSKFRNFIIQLHQHYYPIDQTQVGFIGTLLSKTTLA